MGSRMLQAGNGAAMTESRSEQICLFWSLVGVFVSSVLVSWPNIYLTLRAWIVSRAACIYLSSSMQMRSSYLKGKHQD